MVVISHVRYIMGDISERPGDIELLPLHAGSYASLPYGATDVDAVGADATATAEQTDQVCGDGLQAMSDYICRTISEYKGWKRVLLRVSGATACVVLCVVLSPILLPSLIYIGIFALIVLPFVGFK
ncbi:MAG: hypothetical protein OXF02_04575 [Simkaniaceae bacterium]|nr:hypothetical protein [Simkaniaceae bacterium]